MAHSPTAFLWQLQVALKSPFGKGSFASCSCFRVTELGKAKLLENVFHTTLLLSKQPLYPGEEARRSLDRGTKE